MIRRDVFTPEQEDFRLLVREFVTREVVPHYAEWEHAGEAPRSFFRALGEIGVFEVNEAFAPIPLAWQAEIGAPLDRVNPLGGAIALGHPLGASGAVLATRMIHYMRDNNLRYGLQTMCEGGGTANATLLELV